MRGQIFECCCCVHQVLSASESVLHSCLWPFRPSLLPECLSTRKSPSLSTVVGLFPHWCMIPSPKILPRMIIRVQGSETTTPSYPRAPIATQVLGTGVARAQPRYWPTPLTCVIRSTLEYNSQVPQQLAFENRNFFRVIRDINNQGLWYEAHNPMGGSLGLVPRVMFEEFSDGRTRAISYPLVSQRLTTVLLYTPSSLINSLAFNCH